MGLSQYCQCNHYTKAVQTRPYAVLVGGGLDNRRSEHLFRPGARRWLPRPATTASSQAGAAILSSSTGTRRAQKPVVHWRRMDQTALGRVMIWQLPISCLALRLKRLSHGDRRHKIR